MYIDENTLKFYLNDDDYKKLENSKKAINKRFDSVKEVFEIITDKNNNFDKPAIIDKVKKLYSNSNNNVKKLIDDDNDNRDLARIFINDTRFHGIKEQNKELQKFLLQSIKNDKNYIKQYNFITHLLSIMGGFDFTENPNVTPKVINEYRILSNKQKEYDFEGSTYSQGTCAWINSHFSDNTLFIEFVDFIKNCKEKYDGANIGRTNIALCYPGRVTNINTNDFDNPDNIKNDYNKQQEILNYRFPYKFMWMWANADNVIHPISLDAFRNFLKSDFMQEIFKELPKDENFKILKCKLKGKDNKKETEDDFKKFDLEKYAEIITDCHFDSFPKIWQSVSNKIYKKIFGKDVKITEDHLQKLSKVISLLCIGETDMKNISDLLKTHKQIILYGVPGTGKTYSAKEIIKEWQTKSQAESLVEKAKADEKNELDDCKFSKLLVDKNQNKKDEEKYKNFSKDTNIIWDIVQFHPNYSYQDFIGGIAPNVKNDGSLSYKLNDGIFKKFCDCAKENKEKDFIFIIDEINRANLSEVFGELLYALEYRDENVSVANFDEFCIPSNVYIIGTMNNVDKSLATFDLALRRRFGFYEVGVDYGAIHEAFKEYKQSNDEKDNFNNIDSYVQRCIELNYFLSGDEDLSDYEDKKKKELEAIKLENTQDYYKIGHAYFMKIKSFIKDDEKNINRSHLEKLWIYHIEPLLMEYLGLSYDDNNIKERIGKIKEYFTKKLDEE
ncbi:AAA family ATPase [Campylobacter sp. RM12651]|uniref:McrB family protein n=1 Tax=Campylobacter sp. RM12651 TaxID=1660079 RepID=UPI001EFAF70D|nr:AAA family ATPase [Campylobacter sp. RM12651]ULO03550.1 type IV methyl-directed restriction system, component McrB [Campylobacter sp. RM12651]